MMHVTRFNKILLSYTITTGYSGTLRKRARAGKHVMKCIGECIESGGAVSATTYYNIHGTEFIDATLIWGKKHVTTKRRRRRKY